MSEQDWDTEAVEADQDARWAAKDAEIKRLREALEAASVALNDWVTTYADDMCAEKDVKESWVRIGERGGTLAYIAHLQEFIATALKGSR